MYSVCTKYHVPHSSSCARSLRATASASARRAIACGRLVQAASRGTVGRLVPALHVGVLQVGGDAVRAAVDGAKVEHLTRGESETDTMGESLVSVCYPATASQRKEGLGPEGRGSSARCECSAGHTCVLQHVACGHCMPCGWRWMQACDAGTRGAPLVGTAIPRPDGTCCRQKRSQGIPTPLTTVLAASRLLLLKGMTNTCTKYRGGGTGTASSVCVGSPGPTVRHTGRRQQHPAHRMGSTWATPYSCPQKLLGYDLKDQ